MKQTLLFLCPHNAAKSVIAASYCQREANSYGLDLQIETAGTEPDKGPATAVVVRLRADGLDVSQHVPRLVTAQDLEQADWIISLGCDLEPFGLSGKKIESWPDVPPPSRDLEGAIQAIRDYLAPFMANIIRGHHHLKI